MWTGVGVAATGLEVSTRELSRRTRAVLDRAEGGETLLVTRDGRAVAVVIPLPTMGRIVSAVQDELPEPDPFEGVDLEALDENEKTLLQELDKRPRAIDSLTHLLDHDAPAVAIALSKLELKGLCRKTFAGYVRGP